MHAISVTSEYRMEELRIVRDQNNWQSPGTDPLKEAQFSQIALRCNTGYDDTEIFEGSRSGTE